MSSALTTIPNLQFISEYFNQNPIYKYFYQILCSLLTTSPNPSPLLLTNESILQSIVGSFGQISICEHYYRTIRSLLLTCKHASRYLPFRPELIKGSLLKCNSMVCEFNWEISCKTYKLN